jgi:NAD(P)H-hydrate epimerase
VPWLSVEQMREVDRLMIDEVGISLVQMMENAGRNLAALARHLLGGNLQGRSLMVLAGPGGNGGGGLVAARHLANAGANVAVALATEPERLTPVPAQQLSILRRLAIPVEIGAAAGLGDPDLVVDALLGYSQRGDPHGGAATLIRWSAGRRLLALDVPSGLELATGIVRSLAVEAEATMTLALPKQGLAAPVAAANVGRLFLADISVPELVYQRLGLRYESPFAFGPLVELVDRIRP